MSCTEEGQCRRESNSVECERSFGDLLDLGQHSSGWWFPTELLSKGGGQSLSESDDLFYDPGGQTGVQIIYLKRPRRADVHRL